MMRRYLLFILGVSLAGILQSCMHEPDLEGIPEVSFQNDIKRILNGNCTFSGCHDGISGQDGLNTYAEVMKYVERGNGRDSELYRVVSGRSWEEMPPEGYPELSSDDIKLIFIWIEQGAKNN